MDFESIMEKKNQEKEKMPIKIRKKSIICWFPVFSSFPIDISRGFYAGLLKLVIDWLRDKSLPNSLTFNDP